MDIWQGGGQARTSVSSNMLGNHLHLIERIMLNPAIGTLPHMGITGDRPTPGLLVQHKQVALRKQEQVNLKRPAITARQERIGDNYPITRQISAQRLRRHPLPLSRKFTNLDQLSHGQLLLGCSSAG